MRSYRMNLSKQYAYNYFFYHCASYKNTVKPKRVSRKEKKKWKENL